MGSNKWDHYFCGPFWTPWFINPWNFARNCTCLVQALLKHGIVSGLQSRCISVGSVYQEKLTSCFLLKNTVPESLDIPSSPSCSLVWWKLVEAWGQAVLSVCWLVFWHSHWASGVWWMLLCNRPATWVRAWPWTSMLAEWQAMSSWNAKRSFSGYVMFSPV